VTRPRSSSSSSSSRSPEAPAGGDPGRTPSAKRIVREGEPVRYAARVEYDGTEFSGFQVQPGRRTVQGVLEQALASLNGGRRVVVDAAGRTDTGVHALDQVVAFTYGGRLSRSELERALLALLPRDVSIGGLRKVAPGWKPRYAAVQREYRYAIWTGPRSPIRERFALGVTEPLDVAAMTEAAEVFVGRHDFSAFGGADRQPIRTLHRVRVRRTGRTITIDVVGDAFLRQMVRSIVAALLRVGRGEVTAKDLEAALRQNGRAFAGAVAPPQGLTLRRVRLGKMRQRNETGPE
jgi:tRNA pseudouridine38-40 synthase